jgi:hypothetical protein
MIIVSAEDPEIGMPLILESVSVQNPGRPGMRQLGNNPE